MADRNMQFPHGQGYGMMQGTPQYVQPGAPVMPQQRMMMAQGQGQMMNPGQGHMVYQNQGRGPVMGPGMFPPQNTMGMRMPAPRAPPPTYSRSHADSYQQKMNSITAGAPGVRPGMRPAGKTEEQIQKERKFQEQQARLKQFGKKASSGGLDPNKLIDSMFHGQEPPKPRTIKKQVSQPKEDPDDSFGDFLSSPQLPPGGLPGLASNGMPGTTPPPAQLGQGTTPPPQLQTPPIAVTPPQVQKKDLTEMMFESCDLTAPQKAKLFQKPALNEINRGQRSNSLVTAHHDSNTARKWGPMDELSDLFIQEAVKDEQTIPKVAPVVKKHVSPTSKHPPKPPPWLTDETLLPALYKQVLEAVTVDEKISTERLYPILMMSGLPKELMGHLWGLCNKITPGQLRTVELYELLGLIGLTQNNYQVESLDILSRCPYPPVPYLGQQVQQQVSQGQSAPPTTSPAQSPPLPVPGATPPPQPGIVQTPPYVVPCSIQTSFGPVPGAIPNSSHIYQETHFPSSIPAAVLPPMGVGVAVSSPATLPVTQLPPAVLPQRMVGNVVAAAEDDDDFDDFQTAPAPPAAPVSIPKPGQVTSPGNIPAKAQTSYLSSVPIPDDKAVAASLPPNALKNSTVDNFFGSDDSSEATSPDDDYFDGYKSADSKPSDSTSQFSTDQSEGEDFRNFENYLDEFQRKKEKFDKESPLHRPVARHTLKNSPTRSPTKLFSTAQVSQIQKIPLPSQVVKTVTKGQASSEEFSDFADFQSAPVTNLAVSDPDPLKATASASDLIGDEDKYAALRVLDFSSPPGDEAGTEDNPETDAGIKPPSDQDESWADFQTASGGTEQNSMTTDSETTIVSVKDAKKDSILQLYNKKDDDEDEWAAFDAPQQPVATFDAPQQPESSETDWVASLPPVTRHQKDQSDKIETSFTADNSLNMAETADDDDDWADFQSTADDSFSGVSEPKTEQPIEQSRSSSSSSIVNVKKDGLGASEILGLFKVKDEPKLDIKSRDDDPGTFATADVSVSVSESMNKMHGISSSSSRESSPYTSKVLKRAQLPSEDDDFMKPPPLDMADDNDDNDHFGSYTRGYDLDDIMQTKREEKKKVYGIYGVNENFVVSGHKKVTKTGEDNKGVTIEITKDSDLDNDSDSASSKDNDTFRGKFGLGKELGEDSQSVSSLDFVVNKHLQTVKDVEGMDNQSVSSAEFGSFETGNGMSALQESKSVDSLELRGEDTAMDSAGSLESSDKESKETTPERDVQDDSFGVFDAGTTPGLPVVGDRYSNIMHDVPGSDKHASEWQLCLDNACRMIQDANNTFNSISSSSVCNEVIKSAQGSQYVDGVIEIYKVICRIQVSATKAGVHSDKLSALLKSIDLAWNNLTAFLVGGSVMPDSLSLDFSHGVLLSDCTAAQYRACGVCLLDVEMKARGAQDDNSVLVYGGRQYHAPCANFWVNCVRSTLPALKLLELL